MELGVEWIWLGLESSETDYAKLKGADTLSLVRELHAHGICVHGSTIIGLEHHTPENIGPEIDRAVAHDAVFHQFMLYTPMPGTALHAQIAAEGRLLPDVDLADTHGQFKFNFRHPAIGPDDSKTLLDRAFRLDFERNGPSLFRLQTMMVRWQRYRADNDPRVRARVAVAAAQLRAGYGAALWAMEHYLRPTNPPVSARIRALRLETEREFGVLTAAANRVCSDPCCSARRSTTADGTPAGADASRARSSSGAKPWLRVGRAPAEFDPSTHPPRTAAHPRLDHRS